ncbi:MAG: hypothetical protein JWP78_2185 [Mucilaginibacter sp.]|nr:hypothetical protein [Mucilaginibacter sp.]
MHLHAYQESTFKEPVKDYYGNGGSASAELHFKETYHYLRQFHVAKAVVSGSVESLDYWMANDTDHGFIRGFGMNLPDDYCMDSAKFETLVKAGKIKVFGEVGPYYSCTTLSDPAWRPYLRICEKYDIPVHSRRKPGWC